MDKPIITPLDDGPLCVTPSSCDCAARLLRDHEGTVVDEPAPYSLCRCGASSTKPFCDGTHNTIGFDSTNTCDHVKDFWTDYVGEKITVHNNAQLCSVSERCVKGLPMVFRSGRSPWCDPDAATVEDIIAVIESCPSGALAYTIDGVRHDSLDREPSIRVTKDGPYEVRGSVCIEADPGGADCSREHYALCRCGASRNKPYCDGSHWEVRFTDPVE
jgi:CDGSH-type Zn-finger protein